jgi:hypothetical protein
VSDILLLLSQAYSLLYTVFDFNFKNSIFRCLKSLRESGGHHIPFKHFIAIPLLPCDDLDTGLQKFTGSDDIGDASNDITKAIHAFTHFGLIYTRQSLLFCDLQGPCLVLLGADTNLINDATSRSV